MSKDAGKGSGHDPMNMLERINFNPNAGQKTGTTVGEGIIAVRSDPAKPALFKDVYDSVRAQRLREEIAAGDVDIPFADLRPSFEATIAGLVENMLFDDSDPQAYLKTAMAVRLGQLHNAQWMPHGFGYVSDKLAALQEAAQAADYVGLSNAEKYAAIYERYAEAFGADFLKTTAISYPGNAQSAQTQIIRQFNSELEAVLGDSATITAACRTYQYGNMSAGEIRRAIVAKYPPMEKITLREFHYLVWEMNMVGVDDGLANVLNRATDMNTLVREELLDKPLDASWLYSTYQTMRNAAAKTFYNDVGNSAAVLRELGINGAAARPTGAVSYQTLIRQITRTYQNWSGANYENWLRSSYGNVF